MRKYLILMFIVTSITLISLQAQSKVLTEDLIENHYEITMPEGDEGTIYFSSDGAMIFMPFITNNTFTKNCWGDWKFIPKTQKLLIKNANKCSILNGDYRLEKIQNGYEIHGFGKIFTLRHFHKL